MPGPVCLWVIGDPFGSLCSLGVLWISVDVLVLDCCLDWYVDAYLKDPGLSGPFTYLWLLR
jgi:hypothetical protein